MAVKSGEKRGMNIGPRRLRAPGLSRDHGGIRDMSRRYSLRQTLSPLERAFIARFAGYPHSLEQNDAAITEKLAREVGYPAGTFVLTPQIVDALHAAIVA